MRNRYILLLDLPAITVAAYGAFVLRFDWLFVHRRSDFILFVLAALVVKPIVLYCFGMYARYWKYASVQDMIAVFLAVSTATLVMAILVAVASFSNLVIGFSRPLLLIDWLLALSVIGGIRMSVRILSEQRSRSRNGRGTYPKRDKRVLVAGAGSAGSMVVREMNRNPRLGMTPIGYLDDDQAKRGVRINGVPVLGDMAAVADIARSRAIDEVVIAMPRAPGVVVRAVTERCRAAGVPSRVMPGVFELLDGVVSVNRLRNVDIADLLRRSQIIGDGRGDSYIAGRTVLVTGAGGSIGYELCRQCAHAEASRIILLGHGENSIFEATVRLTTAFPGVALNPVIADVRDRARLEGVFRVFHPAIVYHAAAHKHVPLMEANPVEAVSNNVLGTRAVVDAASEFGTERFVLISTDKAVAPTSFMGASKRIAGMIVREAARETGRAFVVVRFGNVLGSRGSVVPIFKQQIERGGPVTVTHPEMKRFFMTIPEAVHLVLEAGGMGKGGELFVLNMGEQIRIVELARDLIRLSGFAPEEIPITYTGARPGEKMEEALWEDGAVVRATANPDVLQVTERETKPAGDLSALVQGLRAAVDHGDRAGIAALLAEWIPNFVVPIDDQPSGRSV